jgi:hypothetical protein
VSNSTLTGGGKKIKTLPNTYKKHFKKRSNTCKNTCYPAQTLAISAQTLANFLTLDSLAQQTLSCGIAAVEGGRPFKGASRDSRPVKVSCARPTSRGVETKV